MSDLISKEALIEELKKSRKYHAQNGRELELLCRCENIVNEQPTVEAVPKSYADQIRWERDVAIEQLAEIGVGFGRKMDEVKMQLEASQWISCSERLPEEDGEYLTWIRYDGHEFMSIEDFECSGLLAQWNFEGRNGDEVIAWMPLPEAYKEERGGKNE